MTTPVICEYMLNKGVMFDDVFCWSFRGKRGKEEVAGQAGLDTFGSAPEVEERGRGADDGHRKAEAPPTTRREESTRMVLVCLGGGGVFSRG